MASGGIKIVSSTFFCDLDALTPQQRERHRELAQTLRPQVSEFRELTDGYAAEFRSSHDLESRIEEFLILEKLCCPFFELRMVVINGDAAEPVCVVNITGPGDIKPFIRVEFGIPGN